MDILYTPNPHNPPNYKEKSLTLLPTEGEELSTLLPTVRVVLDKIVSSNLDLAMKSIP